ncbi:MAG: hypothetical protein HYR77_06475 [Ignavibacteria bacterium]|nr:hypothetical protein [Ignavibacteria bacterium]
MHMNRKHFPWVGILLIIAGTVLLLNRLDMIDVRFSQILWPFLALLGLFQVGQGFSHNRSGQIFGGTVLFLYSLFFFLRTTDYVDFHGYMFFPATFIVIGIAFFMVFLNNLREWLFLIPACILIGVGAVFFFSEMGFIDTWDAWRAVHTYWPVALIVSGLAIILRRRRSQQSPPMQPPPMQPPPMQPPIEPEQAAQQ